MMGLFLLLVWHALAQPDPSTELLAPRLSDLLSHLARAEAHLETADALGVALGRVHNTMLQEDHLRCADPAAVSLAWRAEVLGGAWRDALQSARAEADRLTRMRDAATVAPLLDVARHEEMNAVNARLGAAVRAWRTAAGWQAKHVLSWYRRCPWEAPTAQPGLPAAIPRAEGESDRIAVIVLSGGGVLCPDQRRLGGVGAVVLDGEAACLSKTDACGCVPAEVLPGAILPELL